MLWLLLEVLEFLVFCLVSLLASRYPSSMSLAWRIPSFFSSDYPWDSLPKGSTVVDVGGGEGALLLPILKAFPHLSGCVQDRPETIGLAKKNFETNLPEAIKDNRVEFQAHDFFTPQPKKGDEYVYVARWILHDYADDNCVKILKSLASSMSKTSKVLIIDTVMQPALIGEKDGKLPFPWVSDRYTIEFCNGSMYITQKWGREEVLLTLNRNQRDDASKQADLTNDAFHSFSSPFSPTVFQNLSVALVC